MALPLRNGNAVPARVPRRLVLRVWTWEIASLAVAVGLLVAIVTLLVKYDGHELPQWPYSINLNTIMSLLSLFLRAALVVVAAEVVGQSKWIWFADRQRQLRLFETFDDASRGLFGSLSLVALLRFGLRGSPLAVAAALTIIISLAISPFTQQAIKTVSCSRLVSDVNASIPVANAIPGADSYYQIGGSHLFELGPGVQGAMINSIANAQGNSSAIQPSCPTGNCTFPEVYGVTHSTIGICVECVDTTSLASTSWKMESNGANTTNITLGGVWISPTFMEQWLSVGASNLSEVESAMTPTFKDVALQSLTNVSVLAVSKSPCRGPKDCPHNIRFNQFEDLDFVAASCTLYSCVKDIKAKVTAGRLEEQILNTTPARVSEVAWQNNRESAGYDRVFLKSPCVVDDKLYDVSNFSLVPKTPGQRIFTTLKVGDEKVNVPSDCYYTVYGEYAYALGYWMGSSFLSGRCSNTGSNVGDSIYCHSSWWLPRLYAHGNASFDSLHLAFQDLATAATNFFRSDGWGAINDTRLFRSDHPFAPKGRIRGEVHQSTICMRLDWPWLLLPGLMCLITIALLGIMLFINARHRQPVWKSSPLPLLFFGLDAGRQADERPEGAYADSLDSLQQQAKGVTAMLHLGGARSRPGFLAVDEDTRGEGDVDSLMLRDQGPAGTTELGRYRTEPQEHLLAARSSSPSLQAG